MPYDPFSGCRAKFQRAKYHLEQLALEIKSDGNSHRYRIITGDDPETREHFVEALLPSDLFIRYGGLIGEVVHQLRSSLDHVVWELVPEPKEGRTGLPVFRQKKRYEERGLAMIEGINDEAAKIIRGLQPFGPDYEKNLLYLLNELWNREKHRLLVLTFVKGIAYKAIYIYPSPPGRTLQVLAPLPSPVEDGAELYRFKHPPDFTPQVRLIETTANIGLVFKEAGHATGWGVLELLTSLSEFVESRMEEIISTHHRSPSIAKG